MPPCRDVREALSAMSDGENHPLVELAEEHLDGCHACRRFAASLPALNRGARLQRAVVPDLSSEILLAVGAEYAAATNTGAAQDRAKNETGSARLRQLRWLVGFAGAIQIALAIPMLLGSGATDLHMSRELGAWGIAFGVGLVVAAAQPQRARGLIPVVSAVALVAVGGALFDLAAGRATLGAEVVHLLELIGVPLVMSLARRVDGGAGAAPAAATQGL